MEEEVKKEVTAEAQPEKTFTSAEVQELMKKRLRQEREAQDNREAQLKAEIESLKKKAPEPVAAAVTQPVTEQPQAKSTPEANPESIPLHLLPHIMEQKKRSDEFNKKLTDAMEKDEEFKKLAGGSNPDGLSVPGVVLENMMHLDNAAAVAKHLLKDKKDNHLMMMAMQGGAYEFGRFINDLSDKLESGVSRPRPSGFTPAPDLSDVGDSEQDFDTTDYIKSKYR